MSKIHTKLNHIQTALKVPKGQRNNFGKYNYRSCEDILQALTPHLEETDTTLMMWDEIESIGDRVYVKSNARLTCCESADEYVVVSAYARESATKKGMDESQMTGAASSYARKYALNGLFAIDDTKDADATNQHGKTDNTGKSQKTPKIDPKQSKEFFDTLTSRFRKCASVEELDSVKGDIGAMYAKMTDEHKEAIQNEYSICKSVLEGE